MKEEENSELSVPLTEVTHERTVCPFSEGKWKRVGDALVFFILFVTPVLFLIAIITTILY